jgi:hypothetical protein
MTLKLLKASPPLPGILSCVKHTVDNNSFIFEFVKHCVRETPDQCPAKSSVGDGVHFGHSFEPLQTGIETRQKLFAKSGTLIFIPREGLSDVAISVCCNH